MTKPKAVKKAVAKTVKKATKESIKKEAPAKVTTSKKPVAKKVVGVAPRKQRVVRQARIAPNKYRSPAKR